MPIVAMITAGSLEGTCCNIGKISSMTSHLSKKGKSFPRQMRPLTRTDRRLVLMINFLILGKRAVFIA